jgi:outer membrane scaffolding protein for murein synthesis (MipA/OmpV family)
MRLHAVIAASLVALAPAAAFAQNEAAPEGSVFDRDHLTIGVGGIYGPSYEGSDDYVLSPIPVVQGRIGGITITPRPGGIAADFIPDAKDARIGFSLGPVATYSGNRKRQIEDPVVRASGKLKDAIDVGVNGGITVNRLLSAYDSLTVSADVKWNVNSAHRGMVVTPAVSYITPLSRAALVTLVVSAKHVDDDYAAYYYGVTPGQRAASGGVLPVYSAKGGWANIGANVLAAYDLDGDLLNGGFAVVGFGGYSKLLNDAKRTPFTSLRGDDSQWVGGLGVAYTF